MNFNSMGNTATAWTVLLLLCIYIAPTLGAEIKVEFVEPQGGYTDFSVDGRRTPRARAALETEIREYVQRLAARYLPANAHLELTFTNIDLAGAYEPWRPRLDNVRIIRDVYPPRLQFSYELRDESGALVKRGSTKLTDLDFLRRFYTQPASDQLRFEKRLLREWFQKTFEQTTTK
jgi:hypothetical protein